MQKVKIFLSQKSQFGLIEKIKNKKRTRASLFQSSEDGKQKKIMWPKGVIFFSMIKHNQPLSDTKCLDVKI